MSHELDNSSDVEYSRTADDAEYLTRFRSRNNSGAVDHDLKVATDVLRASGAQMEILRIVRASTQPWPFTDPGLCPTRIMSGILAFWNPY